MSIKYVQFNTCTAAIQTISNPLCFSLVEQTLSFGQIVTHSRKHKRKRVAKCSNASETIYFQQSQDSTYGSHKTKIVVYVCRNVYIWWMVLSQIYLPIVIFKIKTLTHVPYMNFFSDSHILSISFFSQHGQLDHGYICDIAFLCFI